MSKKFFEPVFAHTLPTMKAINKYSKKSKYTAASFFSGMGGASIGLKMAGYNVLYANEFVPIAADAYDLNSDIKIDRRDIRTVTAKSVLAMCGLKKGELDILDGSPPCKAYSAASAQSHLRERNFSKEVDYSEGIKQRVDDLFSEFTRLLKDLQPKTFIAENVPGLIQNKNKGFFVEIHDALSNCGYTVQSAVIDPSMLGVPQKRQRLIFIGVRKDLAAMGFSPVWPTLYKKETTVNECLPYIVKIKTTKGFIQSTSPSPTLTASDYKIGYTADFSCGGFIETDTGEIRRYTIEELKVLSSVPKDFVFPTPEGESASKHFARSWERLGRIHVPSSVYHITKNIREKILEPYYERV